MSVFAVAAGFFLVADFSMVAVVPSIMVVAAAAAAEAVWCCLFVHLIRAMVDSYEWQI
jgi:hypothetical protein